MDDETGELVQMSVKDRMNLFEKNKETIVKPEFNRNAKANILPARKLVPGQLPQRNLRSDSVNNNNELLNTIKTKDKLESIVCQEKEQNLNRIQTRNLPEPPPLVKPPPRKCELKATDNTPLPTQDIIKSQEIKYPINFSSKLQPNTKRTETNCPKPTPPPVKPPPKLVDLKKLPNPVQTFCSNPENETEEPTLSSSLTRVISPNGNKIIHPPLPPPPTSIKIPELTIKTTVVNNNMPPLPPPPPSTKTSKKTNVLVGWVKSQNSESNVENEKRILSPPNENKTKSIEESKPQPTITVTASSNLHNKNKATEPPPIVVPPPSLEVVQKIKEREASPSRSIENSNSVRSSVQSGIANEEYDEDDPLSGEPWFLNITKDTASILMKGNLKKGAYLMRPSENNQYVLMVRFDSTSVKKFKIQKHNDGWILGDPTKSKKIHQDLHSLMSYFITNGVKFGNATIQLKEPVQNNLKI